MTERDMEKFDKMVRKHLSKFGLDISEYHQFIEDVREEWIYANPSIRKDIEMDIIDYCERY